MNIIIVVTIPIVFSAAVMAGSSELAKVQTTSEKVTKFLDNMTDFFSEILYTITSFIGFEKEKSASDGNVTDWSLKDVMSFTLGTLKSGYKLVKDSIPVLQVARESIESVSLVLPNVTLATFVEHFINNITPELSIKKD